MVMIESTRVLTIPPSLVNTVLPDALSHFGNLELNKLASRVAITVILYQELVRLLVLAVGEEVSGRLGNEKD